MARGVYERYNERHFFTAVLEKIGSLGKCRKK